MNALERIEIDEISEITEEKQQFKINDLQSANWALRKLAALETQAKEVKQLASIERSRIDAYEQKELVSINESKEFFEQLLGAYFIEQRQSDPKFKIKTPYGAVTARKQQPTWTYKDNLISELKENGMNDFIRVKEEVSKADLKKALKVLDNGIVVNEDGVIMENIEVVEQGEKVVIKAE